MFKRHIFFFFLFLFSCSSNHEKRELQSEIVILSEKIKNDPSNINFLLERIAINKANNYLESMLYDYKQIISLDSLNFDFHYSIAEIYFQLSKKPDANPQYPTFVKHHLEQSINLNSSYFQSHALMGELMLAYAVFNEENYKKAIDCFNLSLRLNYNQERTHMLLGYTFKQLGNEEDAINCFRNSINVNPDFYESYVQLGQIFHLRKDTLAIVYYNNALRIDSNNPILLYNKALFYQDMKQWNKSLNAYAQLHKVDPFNSSGHYNLGFIHMELGLYDVAVNNFSDAIYSNSEFYEAYYSRGNCFENLGNILQAESDYKRAIEINPNYNYAIQALESLIEQNKKYNKK
ncbi:MAG: tetratricopeptide repeat protein [Bacteroidota bacterium]|nr:tetratricopeptide repeat protein [Bacteroidota bacterium]